MVSALAVYTHKFPEVAAGAAAVPGQATVSGWLSLMRLTTGAAVRGMLKLIGLKATVFAVWMATAHVPSSVTSWGRVLAKPTVPFAPLVPLAPLAPLSRASPAVLCC
jgi:hypothetical protein